MQVKCKGTKVHILSLKQPFPQSSIKKKEKEEGEEEGEQSEQQGQEEGEREEGEQEEEVGRGEWKGDRALDLYLPWVQIQKSQ